MIGFDPDLHQLVVTHEGTDDLKRVLGLDPADVRRALAVVIAAASGREARRVVCYGMGVGCFVRCTIHGHEVEVRLVHGMKDGLPVLSPDGRRAAVFLRGCREVAE